MAKAKYTGPPEKLELYEALVESLDVSSAMGAANPYTSRNGHMTSFIDKEGEVSIRCGLLDLVAEAGGEWWRRFRRTHRGRRSPPHSSTTAPGVFRTGRLRV